MNYCATIVFVAYCIFATSSCSTKKSKRDILDADFQNSDATDSSFTSDLLDAPADRPFESEKALADSSKNGISASTDGATIRDGTPDISQDGSKESDSCALTTIETVAEDAEVIAERFYYTSSGLIINGLACRPISRGPYPLLIYNHGGVDGLLVSDRELCINFARNTGYLVLMSEYRGEGGSQGSIEGCLGEVDDVLRLLECARSHPDVDPERVVMAGGSHGGCVTVRAVQSGAIVKAAVDIFGPTDWAKEYEFWNSQLSTTTDETYRQALRDLINLFVTVTGGTPDTVSQAYAARSPITYPAALDQFEGDFLIVHGTADPLVPQSQSCRLAASAIGFRSYFIDELGTTVGHAPPVCDFPGLSFKEERLPSTDWPDARYLIIFDGAGHDLNPSVPAQALMIETVVKFLVAKTYL